MNDDDAPSQKCNDNDNDKSNTTTKNNDNNNKDNNENSKKRPAMAITAEGEMPQKRFYRSRAHCNPLSHNDTFDYPLDGQMDWNQEQYYPSLISKKNDENSASVAPTVLDIGCGFGGLTVALSKLLPDEVILGMEIRAKVTEYVRLRLVALRSKHLESNKEDQTNDNNKKNEKKEEEDVVSHSYQNASVLRTNSMKYLPNYFAKASIHKLFFCFPDPHFKRKNHGRRIISERLLSEYAYVLKPGGKLYCITDVKELHEWHVEKCNQHPLFQQIVDPEELQKDACVEAMQTTTEESQKVDRAGSSKYYAVYKRISNEEAMAKDQGDFFQ